MFSRRGRRTADAATSRPAAGAPRRDRQLTAIASLSSALARARDEREVAKTLIDECFAVFSPDFAAVALSLLALLKTKLETYRGAVRRECVGIRQ